MELKFDVPMGAYNVRANGGLAARNNTANIDMRFVAPREKSQK